MQGLSNYDQLAQQEHGGNRESNMKIFCREHHIQWALRWLLLFAFLCVTFVSKGSSLSLVGNGSYSISGNTVILQADELDNDSFSGTSGTIRLELWAFSSPYSGTGSGYKLASY